MNVLRTALAGLAIVAASAGPAPAQGTAPTAAPMVTTALLADLCKATGIGVDAAVAIGYCRGFLVAAWQYHYEISRPGGRMPIFCLPDPAPSLEQAQAGFVAWAGANPQHAEERGVNGLLRWAAATYPCPTQTARGRTAR